MVRPEEVVWVTALRANDIGTLDGITAEEDGLNMSESSPACSVDILSYPVKTNDIVVTLASVELDGETTRVTGSVWELTTDGDSGESKEERSLAANTREEVRLFSQIRPNIHLVFFPALVVSPWSSWRRPW